MSLTRCDRVSRCQNGANHDGPCSYFEPFATLIAKIERWQSRTDIRALGGLDRWIRDELRAAKDALEGK